ncbi:murein transglycosylase A [Noviherbaspirillum pedocola]|uniref:peptidoglycan lytic exotransglycosylase n=1 Tax=Noviherbaspirillum pedocola TaxID=2801341 RepID=A0A934T2G1_9BURK|nr:murein transglycosylase A [Noviherbaspirillum pedocola]MBK4738182.1 murein transglycosylase A [Noviherbaspirillum pedocola]
MSLSSSFFGRLSVLACAASLVAGLAGCVSAPPARQVETPAAPAKPGPVLRPVSFKALPGWERDDLREAWPAFLNTCEAMARRAEWKEPCAIARDVDAGSDRAIRTFFEAFFTPNQVFNPDGSDNGLITGYYEPLLNGSRKRGGTFQTPLYRAPEDLLTIDLSSVYPELKNMRLRGRLVGNKVVPYPARAELMGSNALAGKELLWVDNPIDAFFLQVQGSGRVHLADSKETVRVAYADQNGQPYRSIGRYLVDKGELTMDQASAQGIKAWLAAHPSRQQELLNANPGYVFFKEEKLLDPRKGPKGALGVPLTPQRSVAVDPQYIPLGAPVFLSTTEPGGKASLQRMMLAQDTGGAIRNAVRADFFWGYGPEAGDRAGKMKQRGMLWVLLPKSPAS